VAEPEPGHPKDALITAVQETGYLWQMIGVLEILTGLAFLTGTYLALASVTLAPLSISILAFHIAGSPDGNRRHPHRGGERVHRLDKA
jgi:putative oxidoreductase